MQNVLVICFQLAFFVNEEKAILYIIDIIKFCNGYYEMLHTWRIIVSDKYDRGSVLKVLKTCNMQWTVPHSRKKGK